MRWRNQLEPDALLDAFAAEPPEGFTLLAGLPAPAFAAPFDLLTTADAGFKRKLARLPLYARWSRWLRLRTAFVGTTVSEYAPLPRGVAPEALAAALRQRLGRGYPLSIVKDLPQQSPLLGAEDNAYAEALAQACAAQGCVLVEGQALAYVPIDFDSIDGYLSRLSTSRRKNLKRKLRSRAQVQVRRVPTGEAFASDAAVDAYYVLYQGVFAQSEVHFDRLTRAFFATVLRDARSGGIVFEYRRASHDANDGALVGWNLCYEHGGRLVDKYIGLAYPDARELDLYFVSWMVNLEYALERGLTHYIAGWTDPEVKAKLGAQFTFTRHAVHVRNPVLRALARKFAGRFESDRTWRDAQEAA
ncbi:peptidogalycan biosysnthesis protein [Xylophilus sp.]|uniref:peptidogalycan biosysnthesis protein n=1 Tax=Xylophilus sp. TaxID=2653893 RepID=UPI0013BCEA7E|nr:peptidogalycan biosysnthesis protein [Xylophilus sp.]KAF1048352.1 MAG: hypothetical protein GAK38_01363 [Xylophilus sp.]